MRSGAKKTFYYHADANAVGGAIETPIKGVISSQASVSLPAVGGHALNRTEQFSFENVVSCRSAYSKVSGTAHGKDGPWSVLVTSVVEGFNILEVVTAERIVAQISVDYPVNGGLPGISLAGSHFDGLRLGGVAAPLKLHPVLLGIDRLADTAQAGLTFPTFQKTGQEQAARLLRSVPDGISDGPYGWLFDRFNWMETEHSSGNDPLALCSLVDQVEAKVPGRPFGHVIEIPDFGRVFLGELLVTPRSLQLTMIRAELGCTVTGQVTGGTGGVHGRLIPP